VTPCQDCKGSWSAYSDCKNSGTCNSPAGKRKRTYFISERAGPGGKACPHTNGFVEESDCLCPASEVTPCVDCKGSWSAYTPCKSKGKCGSSAGTRTRTFKITQNAGPGGQQCASKDGEVETSDCAAEVTPCAGCEGSWGAWTPCKSDGVCGSDAGKRTRKFTITKNGEPGGKTCEARNGFVQEECCTATVTPCPPEACVGGFGAPTKCKPKKCGTVEGTQTRTFKIKSNAKHGGALCAHPNGFTETLECEVGAGDVKPCPVDCEGDFGICTDCKSKGVCGKDWGYQFQTYHVKVKAAHGGKKCPYRDGFRKKMRCKADITPCPPRDCVGKWIAAPCKQNKCGEAAGESIERFRITTSAKYGGKECEARNGAKRIVDCNVEKVQQCPVCCIGEWSDFGPCESAGKCSSSKGSRKRTFKVSQKAAFGGAECEHKDGEVEVDHSCEAPITPCPPEDCEGHWKKHSCIAASCGTTEGLRKEVFKITKKERYGGKVCAAKHHEKRDVPCEADHVHCPINCVGAFSEFGECKASHKCGSTKGTKTRTFAITTEAKYGGKQCPRSNGQVETEDCEVPLVPCPPEDCIGAWSEPTPCLQKECGKAAGTQKSTYLITKREKHGGTPCPAKHEQVKTMDCEIVEDKIKQCPVDCVEKWTAWEKCIPHDCGCTAGLQKRTYEIVSPALHGGKECKFKHGSTHTQPCEADVRDVERCPNQLLDEPCEDLEEILKQSKETRCKMEAIFAALTSVATTAPVVTSAAPEPEATSAAPEPEATSAAETEAEATTAAKTEAEATTAAVAAAKEAEKPKEAPVVAEKPKFVCEKLGNPEKECARFGMVPISKDDFNQKTASRDADLTLVKAGTCYTLYPHAEKGTELSAQDGKDISHVTYCREA